MTPTLQRAGRDAATSNAFLPVTTHRSTDTITTASAEAAAQLTRSLVVVHQLVLLRPGLDGLNLIADHRGVRLQLVRVDRSHADFDADTAAWPGRAMCRAIAARFNHELERAVAANRYASAIVSFCEASSRPVHACDAARVQSLIDALTADGWTGLADGVGPLPID